MSQMFKTYKYFVTAPLFYINGFPHIGHIYTVAVADAINRYKRLTLKTDNTIFLTGTDEHGEKIQLASVEAGQKPDGYCGLMTATFEDIFRDFNHTINCFKRTSDMFHMKKVQNTFRYLQRRDYIYKDNYEGFYSMIDQAFVPKSQVVTKTVDGQEKHYKNDTDEQLELLKEDCYMFTLQKFKPTVLDWLRKSTPIFPRIFNNDAIQMLEEMKEDLCVTRPAEKVFWAPFVRGDSTKTIYIWFDALLAYNDVPRKSSEPFYIKQQADCHVFGKDILKFHSIYLPAFQLAIDYQLPTELVCHSHWLLNNTKMSKSKGNVVTPLKEVRYLTHEGLRYYLLRTGNLHNDINYDRKAAIDCVNAEIVNKLVNLVMRSLSQKINPSLQITTSYACRNKPDIDVLLASLKQLSHNCQQHYNKYNFHDVVDAVMTILDDTNRLFNDREPWNLSKQNTLESKNALSDTLTTAFEVARISSIILQPIIPGTATKILDKLNVPARKRYWEDAKVLVKDGPTILDNRFASTDINRIFDRVGSEP